MVTEPDVPGGVIEMVMRACPDWPILMELDPELQFKHYTAAEAKLAAEVLMKVPAMMLSTADICCDLDRHVFFADHTHPDLCPVLLESDWSEIHDWAERKNGPPPRQ
jgi:hypothetical protein